MLGIGVGVVAMLEEEEGVGEEEEGDLRKIYRLFFVL